MLELYTLANELAQAQADRDEAVAQLIRQRADAGVSTKLDVHRKLVSLATGLAEEELDPMSSELADALEFDRANEKRSGPAPSTARQLMATGEPDPESPGTRSRSVSRNGHDSIGGGGNNNANETTNGLDNDHAVDASSVVS